MGVEKSGARGVRGSPQLHRLQWPKAGPGSVHIFAGSLGVQFESIGAQARDGIRGSTIASYPFSVEVG